MTLRPMRRVGCFCGSRDRPDNGGAHGSVTEGENCGLHCAKSGMGEDGQRNMLGRRRNLGG